MIFPTVCPPRRSPFPVAARRHPRPALTPCLLLYTAPPEKVARLSSSAKDKAAWVVSRGDGGWVVREGMQIKILAIFPFLIFRDGSQPATRSLTESVYARCACNFYAIAIHALGSRVRLASKLKTEGYSSSSSVEDERKHPSREYSTRRE